MTKLIEAIKYGIQGCGVGGKMFDFNSDLSKISDSDSLA